MRTRGAERDHEEDQGEAEAALRRPLGGTQHPRGRRACEEDRDGQHDEQIADRLDHHAHAQTVRHHRRHDRQQQPADDVADRGRSDDDLSHVAVQQAHVEERLGDDRERAHRHGHADEQGEGAAVTLPAHQRDRQYETQREAEGEGQQHAGHADQADRLPLAAQQSEVDVRAGDGDQEQHAQLGHGTQQMHLLRVARQQPVRKAGRDVSEHRGAEQDARGEFAHDGRHAQARRNPSEQRGDRDQQADLQDE
ncbi:hypothetical protein OG953_08505 [Streptomyces sp. NBC_00057]